MMLLPTNYHPTKTPFRISTVANNTIAEQQTKRWLLPYADFLTVLFCITVVWCGLSLKQAYWLRIQNQKLHQALNQASQQLTVTQTQLIAKQTEIDTLNHIISTTKQPSVPSTPTQSAVGTRTRGVVLQQPINKPVR